MMAAALTSASIGCDAGGQKRWDDFWKGEWTGASGPSAGDEEFWTVECAAFSGDKHQELADKLATSLKRVGEIDAEDVWVVHGPKASRVLHGRYQLAYVKAEVASEEHAEGDLFVKLSNEIKTDTAFIRKLAFDDQYPFFSARPVPLPPDDVGPPEWDLRNAEGEYTLNVGVTYNTEALHNYKEAAVEWVRDLRDRGYEAYYYHSPEQARTSICVGTFGPDARIENAEVKALRDREELKYNLENGHIMYRIGSDEEGNRVRMANWSFLARIPGSEDRPGGAARTPGAGF